MILCLWLATPNSQKTPRRLRYQVVAMTTSDNVILYGTSWLPGFARLHPSPPLPSPPLPSPPLPSAILPCPPSPYDYPCDVIERRACETFKNYRQHYVISRHVGSLLGDVSWQPFLLLESPWGGVGQFV